MIAIRAQDEVVASFGATFIGLVVSAFLCGCMIVQMYIYHKSEKAKTDSIQLKVFITSVWLLDFIQLFFQGHVVYDGLITNYGNNNWFMDSSCQWSLAVSIGFNAVIAALVQGFYARRLLLLSERIRALPIAIALLAVVGLAFGLATVAFTFKIVVFEQFGDLIWVVDAWLGIVIVADVAIVSAMCWYLGHKRTGFNNTDVLIDRLLFLTVNTGLLPTIFEVAHIVSFTIARDNFAHMTFNFVAPKLYANSFLATLNARGALSQSNKTQTHVTSPALTSFAHTPTDNRYELRSFVQEPDLYYKPSTSPRTQMPMVTTVRVIQ
jgi:hypothetical protein